MPGRGVGFGSICYKLQDLEEHPASIFRHLSV